jgi:putative addiction module killer protein
VNTINITQQFGDWLKSLKDVRGKAKILVRIGRAENGNFGDHVSVGDGVYEMRIFFGPGYRVYYAQEGEIIYLLLNGGDKSTQQADIQKAKDIWTQYKQEQS